MSHLRIPILTFIALALALWLRFAAGPRVAHAAVVTAPVASAPSPAPVAALESGRCPAEKSFDLATLAATNPYEKLAKLLSAPPAEIAWRDLKGVLNDVDLALSTTTGALRLKMWELCPETEVDKRLAWARQEDYVITVNQYMEETHDAADSKYLQANHALRAKAELTPDLSAYAGKLRRSLERLPALQGFTFRGTVLPEAELLDKYAEGKSAPELAFTSSSLAPATAYDYGFPKSKAFASKKREKLKAGDVRVIFLILGKSARPVAFYSPYWTDGEALFANGTEFRVRAVSPRQADETRFVYLEEK